MCNKKLSVLGPAPATPFCILKIQAPSLTYRLRPPEVLDKEG
jgi:hypothetical protein